MEASVPQNMFACWVAKRFCVESRCYGLAFLVPAPGAMGESPNQVCASLRILAAKVMDAVFQVSLFSASCLFLPLQFGEPSSICKRPLENSPFPFLSSLHEVQYANCGEGLALGLSPHPAASKRKKKVRCFSTRFAEGTGAMPKVFLAVETWR